MASYNREYLIDLANDLWDILYFDVDRFIANHGTVILVEEITDCMPLEEQNACVLRISTDDYGQLKRAKKLFEMIDSAFFLMINREKMGKLSTAISDLFPKVRQYITNLESFGEHKTLREILDDGGTAALDKIFLTSVEKPAIGLIDISDVKPPQNRISTLSGIKELDMTLGGFYGGELSIWTGTRGSGKSTMLGQILLESLEQGKNVCAYSGELPAWRFKQWEMLQAAGQRHVIKQFNPRTAKEYYTIDQKVVKKIELWWRGKFFLYDNNIASANDEDSILSIFDLAYHRYGCTVFLCDNLMTARFGTSSDKDFYRAQSNFTGRMVEFCKKNNVHVHMVAHPRKLNGGSGRPVADDVGGSGDITNRADNVLSMTRLPDDERASEGFDTALEVLKNRAYGTTAKIKLNFDEATRRFYRQGDSPDRKYSWDNGQFAELPPDTEMPEGF